MDQPQYFEKEEKNNMDNVPVPQVIVDGEMSWLDIP